MSDICDSEKHFYNWSVTNSFQSIGRWSGDAPSARNSNSSLSRQPTNLFHNLYFHASKREICDIFGSFVHDSWHVVVQTEESFLLQTTICLLYFDSQWLAVCIRIPCQLMAVSPAARVLFAFLISKENIGYFLLLLSLQHAGKSDTSLYSASARSLLQRSATLCITLCLESFPHRRLPQCIALTCKYSASIPIPMLSYEELQP